MDRSSPGSTASRAARQPPGLIALPHHFVDIQLSRHLDVPEMNLIESTTHNAVALSLGTYHTMSFSHSKNCEAQNQPVLHHAPDCTSAFFLGFNEIRPRNVFCA